MMTSTRRGQRTKAPISTLKPRLERLEARLALSGFGPEDGAYITEPWVGDYNAVRIQPTDQAIVAAGIRNTVDATESFNAIAAERYDAAGNADSSFGSNGLATVLPPSGYSGVSGTGLTLQADGKLVLATGVQGGASNIDVVRLTPGGVLDNTFGSGGQTVASTSSSGVESVQSAAIQSTGKIVVAGESANAGVVARFTTTGKLDVGKTGFGDVVRRQAVGYHRATEMVNPFAIVSGSWFNSSAVQADDKVVVAGQRTTDVNGVWSTTLVVERYTASGVRDTTFAGKSGWTQLPPPPGAGATYGYAVAIQSDGKIVVAGADYVNGVGRQLLVARFNANGSLDTTFGGGTGYVQPAVGSPQSWGYGVAIEPDGKIVVAGGVAAAGSPIGTGVLAARLNPNGTLDPTFGGAGYKVAPSPANHSFDSASGLALQSDGSIIVAGTDYDSTSGHNIDHPLLVRFYGDNAPASTSTSTATSSTATATDSALMYLLTDPSLPGNKRK